MKRGQETNHIRKQEAGTQDTHETGLTVLFDAVQFVKLKIKFKFKFKLSFIVIPLHVGTYSGTKCRASRVHGAT